MEVNRRGLFSSHANQKDLQSSFRREFCFYLRLKTKIFNHEKNFS